MDVYVDGIAIRSRYDKWRDRAGFTEVAFDNISARQLTFEISREDGERASGSRAIERYRSTKKNMPQQLCTDEAVKH